MMGILAYETFIGWNVLRPGARAMGSVTLLLRILNHPPGSHSPGHGLALPLADRTVDGEKAISYTRVHRTHIIRCPGETSRGNKVKNRVSRRRAAAAAASFVIRGLSSPGTLYVMYTALIYVYIYYIIYTYVCVCVPRTCVVPGRKRSIIYIFVSGSSPKRYGKKKPFRSYRNEL